MWSGFFLQWLCVEFLNSSIDFTSRLCSSGSLDAALLEIDDFSCSFRFELLHLLRLIFKVRSYFHILINFVLSTTWADGELRLNLVTTDWTYSLLLSLADRGWGFSDDLLKCCVLHVVGKSLGLVKVISLKISSGLLFVLYHTRVINLLFHWLFQ